MGRGAGVERSRGRREMEGLGAKGAIEAQNGEGVRGRRCQRERNAGNKKGHEAPSWTNSTWVPVSVQSLGQSSKSFTAPVHPHGMGRTGRGRDVPEGIRQAWGWGLWFVPQITVPLCRQSC